MRIHRPSHRNAHTFLVYVFGRGLDGERYAIERFRSRPDGRIDPVEPEQPKARRAGASRNARSSPRARSRRCGPSATRSSSARRST